MKIDGVDLDPANLGQDLLQLLVGERWPNGDEGAMRSLAAAWSQAAEEIGEIRQTASAAAARVAQFCQGENAESFQSFWSAAFDDGRTSWPSGQAPAALPFAETFCQSMGKALSAGANQIETTKDTIMGNIAILVATVAPQIAAGFFDFGATDATAIAEVEADRVTMQGILDGAKALIEEMVKQAIEQGLMQAELNFLIQVKEVAEGHASSIDLGQVASSGLSGAEGGALGAGFGFGLGKLGGKAFGDKFGSSFLGKAATGVVSGQLTNATMDLMQNGTISASDFTKGSLAGVLGGVGGAEAAGHDMPDVHMETPEVLEGGGIAAGEHTVALNDAAATDLSGLDLAHPDTGEYGAAGRGTSGVGYRSATTVSDVSAVRTYSADPPVRGGKSLGDWYPPVDRTLAHSPDLAVPDPTVPDPTAAEPARVALEELRSGWPELDRALAGNPVARDNLLTHPESVRMLQSALHDVEGRLDAAGIGDVLRGGVITPEVRAKVDAIISGLRTRDRNPVLENPAQLAVSREIGDRTTPDGYRQQGFAPSRREDPAYQAECVDRLRDSAPRDQGRLNSIVADLARENGGEASWRLGAKDRGRALRKVREYVEDRPDGDASLLVDVVGAKIRFDGVDELYRALDQLKNDPRLEIVRIKDRVAKATESGNRSILMNVRLEDGQVAELKFGLKSFEKAAIAEHPLYEVRRDLDSVASSEHREPTPVESLIKAATEAQARRAYGAAWNREMAVSRLRELLPEHRDVVRIAQCLVLDSVDHPTNVAMSLADPATRDCTIALLGELADRRILAGASIEEYLGSHPGAGPLFEPVDPSINTTADGTNRMAVYLEQAKPLDPARGVGPTPTAEESAQLRDYANRLRENVQPAVEAEVRRLVEQSGGGMKISVRTKSADGILDKVMRMTTGSPGRPSRPDYRAGDVIDAVGARITTSDMRELGRILEAAKSSFGLGDQGRILELDNMYASPKPKNPAYRVIPLVVKAEVDGRPYTYELQLTTARASVAADIEHNTLFKPYVEMTPREKATVRAMLAEAAALDQEETR